MCKVNLPENGRIGALGLEFKSATYGMEVTKIESSGLVGKSGKLSRYLFKDGDQTDLGLIEINHVPVHFDCSKEEVESRLTIAGCELALLFLPMDLVMALHKDQQHFFS
ncbi:uncharacterized protein [Diadema setosum]|uniref:uncharacterized protein n=1 Tax=Diadema setosum TaxID=31175 RepID=UPI003B3BC5DC